MENSNVICDQGVMSSKELGRAGVAGATQRAHAKIGIRERPGAGIRLRVARDWAEEPIATTAIREHNRRSQIELR